MNIVQYIPVGSKNTITRAELRSRTGLQDRQLREAISQARRTTCICNKQDRNGYYIPDQLQEAKAFLEQEVYFGVCKVQENLLKRWRHNGR